MLARLLAPPMLGFALLQPRLALAIFVNQEDEQVDVGGNVDIQDMQGTHKSSGDPTVNMSRVTVYVLPGLKSLTFQKLIKASNDPVQVTGDQSFIECMLLRKVPFYETLGHKRPWKKENVDQLALLSEHFADHKQGLSRFKDFLDKTPEYRRATAITSDQVKGLETLAENINHKTSFDQLKDGVKTYAEWIEANATFSKRIQKELEKVKASKVLFVNNPQNGIGDVTLLKKVADTVSGLPQVNESLLIVVNKVSTTSTGLNLAEMKKKSKEAEQIFRGVTSYRHLVLEGHSLQQFISLLKRAVEFRPDTLIVAPCECGWLYSESLVAPFVMLIRGFIPKVIIIQEASTTCRHSSTSIGIKEGSMGLIVKAPDGYELGQPASSENRESNDNVNALIQWLESPEKSKPQSPLFFFSYMYMHTSLRDYLLLVNKVAENQQKKAIVAVPRFVCHNNDRNNLGYWNSELFDNSLRVLFGHNEGEEWSTEARKCEATKHNATQFHDVLESMRQGHNGALISVREQVYGSVPRRDVASRKNVVIVHMKCVREAVWQALLRSEAVQKFAPIEKGFQAMDLLRMKKIPIITSVCFDDDFYCANFAKTSLPFAAATPPGSLFAFMVGQKSGNKIADLAKMLPKGGRVDAEANVIVETFNLAVQLGEDWLRHAFQTRNSNSSVQESLLIVPRSFSGVRFAKQFVETLLQALDETNTLDILFIPIDMFDPKAAPIEKDVAPTLEHIEPMFNKSDKLTVRSLESARGGHVAKVVLEVLKAVSNTTRVFMPRFGESDFTTSLRAIFADGPQVIIPADSKNKFANEVQSPIDSPHSIGLQFVGAMGKPITKPLDKSRENVYVKWLDQIANRIDVFLGDLVTAEATQDFLDFVESHAQAKDRKAIVILRQGGWVTSAMGDITDQKLGVSKSFILEGVAQDGYEFSANPRACISGLAGNETAWNAATEAIVQAVGR